MEFKRRRRFDPQIAPPPPPPAPPVPPPPPAVPAKVKEPIALVREDIEEIAEVMIAKKWKKLTAELEKVKGDLDLTKEETSKIKDNLAKLTERMTSLEKAIFAKVEEYGHGIADVGIELKAMQRVFKTIMPEFTANIKELRALVEKAKKKK